MLPEKRVYAIAKTEAARAGKIWFSESGRPASRFELVVWQSVLAVCLACRFALLSALSSFPAPQYAMCSAASLLLMPALALPHLSALCLELAEHLVQGGRLCRAGVLRPSLKRLRVSRPCFLSGIERSTRSKPAPPRSPDDSRASYFSSSGLRLKNMSAATNRVAAADPHGSRHARVSYCATSISPFIPSFTCVVQKYLYVPGTLNV